MGEVHGDGTFNLYYWDGDIEVNVPLNRIAWLHDCHIRRRHIRPDINEIIRGRLKASLHPADKKTANTLQ